MNWFLIFALLFAAWNAPGQITPGVEEVGRALAADLRDAIPEKESEIHGTLQIRSRKTGPTNNVPVTCRIVLTDNGWETIYQTQPVAQIGAEKLVVHHQAGSPNQYFYAQASGPEAPLPEPQAVPASQTDIPLAGSDFSLADLGLEFLHWPEQRRIKGEMRLGRSCHVLESTASAAVGEIVRVKSWIDKETGGLLIAEAYDTAGKQVKAFSLSGSSFTKINGRWQLEKMEIRNVRTGSKTTLRFQLPKD